MSNERKTALRRQLIQMGNPFKQLSEEGEDYLIECRYCGAEGDSKMFFAHEETCPYEVVDLELERLIAKGE